MTKKISGARAALIAFGSAMSFAAVLSAAGTASAHSHLGAASGGVEASAAAAAEAGETVIASGTWSKVSFKSSGQWSIVERDGKRYIELSDDFRTRNAPDLKIFLSPKAAGSLDGKNATDGSFRVAELSSNKGGQSYELPDDLDLSAYETVIIHCEAYSKLWSVSSLA
ncbi:MAG: DM13 domain-containing protein [Pseudomonadota bacterium]